MSSSTPATPSRIRNARVVAEAIRKCVRSIASIPSRAGPRTSIGTMRSASGTGREADSATARC